jgi:hypothetical protein
VDLDLVGNHAAYVKDGTSLDCKQEHQEEFDGTYAAPSESEVKC